MDGKKAYLSASAWRRWTRRIAVTAALALALPGGATARSAHCEAAARQAAGETGVPLAVLRAIALTETGRRMEGTLRPWPWTVNMEGAGRWFDTEAEALAFAERHKARGARSFDVGCFQINYRWHGHAFASVAEMFDPLANARYAAGFLSRLHAETGDWSAAAGAYHSRTPKYAKRYRARFDRFLAGLPDAPEATPVAAAPRTAPAPAAAPRTAPQNRYPLLLAERGAGRLGSLVPLGGASARPLFSAEAGG